MRAAIVSMIVAGAALLLAPIAAAIWQSVTNRSVPWLFLLGIAVVGLILLAMAVVMLRKQQHQKSRDEILSVADRSFEARQTTPEGQSPIFKRKIRIVLRNDSNKEIEIQTPEWATDAGDLAIQPTSFGAASKIRLENRQAGGWRQDKWLEEADQLIVPPAYHFEAWVGLNHQYTDNTLQRHVRAGRIGTLVFFVLTEGQKREVRIRVT
ncbi:MAG: hypothetical protein ACREFF_15490 [Candidatus Udaeobacter sp.]